VRIAVVALMLIACRTDVTSDSGPTGTTVTTTVTTPVVDASVEAWNPKGIDWKPFDEGLALAKAENKHVCLVLSTTWCPHCKNYSHVFADPRLVKRAKDFVMIRVDADANEAVSRRYRPDGTYVPRTFILDADGNIETGAVSEHPRFKYFFDESRADSLLHAMNSVR